MTEVRGMPHLDHVSHSIETPATCRLHSIGSTIPSTVSKGLLAEQ